MTFSDTDASFACYAANIAQHARIGDAARKRLLIVSTPRSGSTLFCDLLQSSGVLGFPLEYFNLRLLEQMARLRPAPDFVENSHGGTPAVRLKAYVRHLESALSAGGICSVHLHVNNWAYLAARGVDVLQLLRPDTVIGVRRRTRLKQAYSLAMSSKYDYWDSRVADPRPADATVSRTELLKALVQLAEEDAFYDAHIARHVVREFWHEDFVGCQESVVPAVAELMGVVLHPGAAVKSELAPTTSRGVNAACEGFQDWLGVEA
ncbi:MAG: hypothetical protein FGM40_07870 [Rhodocyclaceae bacterium]|nr:hypothetical protein [Rhodocyclaceae bacterium]